VSITRYKRLTNKYTANKIRAVLLSLPPSGWAELFNRFIIMDASGWNISPHNITFSEQ
jgi:hypothetical protein